MLKNRIHLLALLLVLAIGLVTVLPVQAASTYSIAGVITVNGVGLKGVTVTVKGTTLSAITSNTGTYSIHGVAAASSGTIVASSPYFTFTPASLAFTNLAASLTAQNFTAKLIKPVNFSISGKIVTTAGAALPGVVVSIGTFTATSAADGTYTILNVPILTKGRVVPKLIGYGFTPGYVAVPQLLSNLVNVNFTAAPAFIISGKITDKATGLPLGGVTVTFGTYKAVSSATTGGYTIRNILPGTSGTLTPTLLGKTFTPLPVTISNLQVNMHAQNFVAAP